jgi:Protein of unknown function (DUF3617)
MQGKSMTAELSAIRRIIVGIAAMLVGLGTGLGIAVDAHADGIEAGLWRIIARNQSGGVTSPPETSTKCLTADQVKDLGAAFSPIPQQIVNSTCAPIERSMVGPKLTWHLVCKGQLDMDLSGEFNFDNPHHYTATVRSRAAMGGVAMVDSENLLEGQWVSACP